MTALEDRLRTAIHATAREVPADPPPLRLSPQRARRPSGRRRWITWTAPLVSAAAVVAVVAASLALTGGALHPQGSSGPAGANALPPYYVALTTRDRGADEYETGATAAQVRSTSTGAVIAKVVPPKPYTLFTGITAAADDRTFVLTAQVPSHVPNLSAQQYYREYPGGYFPASRFYLLRIDPAASPGGRMSLQALPAGLIPANNAVHDMALSPDGAWLAADVGPQLRASQLTVFNPATGAKRAWSAKTCSRCSPSSGGLGFGGVNVDALSWTADGHHIAFVWGNTVRLLDTSAAGSNLLASSKPVAVWTAATSAMSNWRGAIITPDGRTVLGIEELATQGPHLTLREQLVKFSTATAHVTATLNNLNVLALNGYEQVLYTNASGSVLVLSYTRPGTNARILHDGRYTPIPWSPYIAAAAW